MARGGASAQTIPTITQAPVTGEAVLDWLAAAQPQDVLVYFTGPMAIQTVPAVAEARRLAEAGKVCLFQQRRGPALFDYCMKKRSSPEREPLSRSEIEDSMAHDLKVLLGVLKRIARNDQPCPSNEALAEEAGLKDGKSARYRLILLMQAGKIDITTTLQGLRIVTICGERGLTTRATA
jgi:hypothetical protein